MLPERLRPDGIAVGLGFAGKLEFPAVCSIKTPPYDGVTCVRFYREIDGDTINAPCFSLTGLVWLSALSDRASGFPRMKTLDCLIKRVHPFGEASAWPPDRSWESPS
jgi:hypothetical protein